MLVSCIVYKKGVKLADIQIDEIKDYVAHPDCSVWVNLTSPNKRDVKKVISQFNIHELAVEDVLEGHQRSKIEEYEDSIFAVLHTLSMQQPHPLQINELVMFVSERYILTIHDHLTNELLAIQQRCERVPEMLKEGPYFLFYAIVDAVADSYLPFLAHLGEELEDIEAQIFEKNDNVQLSRMIIKDLYSLKRQFLQLENMIEPLLDPLAKISNKRIEFRHKKVQPYFHDVYDQLERILGIVEGKREMLITAMQVNLGMITLAEGEMTKRLAAFAALFAIPTMIAGIYGMNFNNIPELNFKYGFYFCLAFMIFVDIIIWRFFKKSKWL